MNRVNFLSLPIKSGAPEVDPGTEVDDIFSNRS